MIGTLIGLLTRRPDLLTDYLFAYSIEARAEIESRARVLARRAVATSIALALTLAFIVLSGVALMLDAAVDVRSGWVLVAVPIVILVLAIIALMCARLSAHPLPRSSLGDRFRQDIDAFRAAMESQSNE